MNSLKSCKKDYLEIYRRVLKYPPFLTNRRYHKGNMEIRRKVRNGEVIARSVEPVTVEDAEKLYALLLVSREPKLLTYKDIEVVGITAYMADIRRLTGNARYDHIKESLKRIAGLVIEFVNHTEKKYMITHLLHDVQYNEKTCEITALVNAKFYRLCKEQGLKINFETYAKLSPVAKNLYSFLISNSGNVFTEDLLIDRAVIQTNRKNNAQALLKNALNDLVSCHAIKSWERYKNNGQWFIKITRYNNHNQGGGDK